MDEWVPEMVEVDAFMSGGGSSRPVPRTRLFANRLIALFVERGWSQRIVTRMFRKLYDSHVGSYHLSEFAEEWMKYKASLSTQETPVGVLLAIGIRPSVVRLLDRRICTPLANTCYTHSQLVEICIEYLFEFQLPITEPDPSPRQTHPFEHGNITSWFFLPDEEDGSSRPPCLNLPFRSSHFREAQVQAVLDTLTTHNPETHDLHFHTTQWRSVKPILRELNHSEGRTCLDFGLYPGFYLSQHLKDALDWGYRLSDKFLNEVAIVVFSLPKTFPSTLRIKTLEGEEWTAVVQEARQCGPGPRRIRNRQVPEIASIRLFDLLFGNMAVNVEDVRYHNALPHTHTPPKTQLTSKTRRGDLFLQEHIAGCLFFQKYIPSNSSRTTNRTRRTTRR